MALIIGPITDPDLTPEQAVVQAAQAIRQPLTPEHIRVTPVAPPPGIGGPVWRWVLVEGAPQVLDTEVTVYPGAEEHGHWRPTHHQAPAEIRGGLVVASEHGWVVVAVHQGDEDEDLTELADQALAHVAALFESE